MYLGAVSAIRMRLHQRPEGETGENIFALKYNMLCCRSATALLTTTRAGTLRLLTEMCLARSDEPGLGIQCRKERQRKMQQEIRSEDAAGANAADSISTYPRIFGPLTVLQLSMFSHLENLMKFKVYAVNRKTPTITGY